MATPAAVLSILVEANTGKAAVALRGMQGQLQATNTHAVNTERSTGRLGKTMGGLSSPAEKASRSIGSLGKSLLVAGGAFVGFEAAKNAIESTVQLGEATIKLTAITGLDAKQASTWIEVMAARGVQTRAVSMAFITLSRNIRNAGEGSKTAVTAFNQLGISAKSLPGKSTEENLLRVAQGLSNLKSPAERAAVAQQLFGRGAQALIPVLAQGRAGVEAMLASAQRYGAFLPNNVKRSEEMVQTQFKLNYAMDGMKIAFTEAVLPSLVKGAQALLGFIAQMRSGTGTGGQFAAVLKAAFQALKSAVETTLPVFRLLGTILLGLTHTFGTKLTGALVAVGIALAVGGPLLAGIAALLIILTHLHAVVRGLGIVWSAVLGAIKRVTGDTVVFILGIFSTLLGGIAQIARVFGKLPGPFGAPFRSLQHAALDGEHAIDRFRNKVKVWDGETKTYSAAIARHYEQMALRIEVSILAARDAIHNGSRLAARYAINNFNALAGQIQLAMASGEISAKEGAKLIAQALQDALTAFGGAKVPGIGKVLAAAYPGIPKFTKTSPALQATGGLIQVGRQGAGGRDNVPMNVGGMPIMVGEGEQVAVFTRHQQRVANQALAGYGGLPGLFSKVNKPNYMATGGLVPGFFRGGAATTGSFAGNVILDSGVNMSVGQEPQILADLRKLSAELAQTVYVISGYRSPSHSVAVGGFSNDPHTRGQAADIGIGGPSRSSMFSVTEPELNKIGLYRPFYPASAAEVNHVQLLAGGATGGGARGAFSNPVWKNLAAPVVQGKGTLSNLVRSGLGKVTAAANALGRKKTNLAGAFAGQGGGNAANEALGHRMMLAAGWGESEWPSLLALWMQESGWSSTVVNPSSGAYGIPQSLGHGHPYNLGDASAQIAWGLNYIRNTYGSPSAAEAHEKANNWYSQGGLLPAFAHGGVIRGPVSWFTGGQTADNKHIASRDPGISLRIPGTHYSDPRNRALMDHMFRVVINGHTADLMDIDLGPNEWTGRSIDVTAPGVAKMGFSTSNFPTNAIGTATELSGTGAATNAAKAMATVGLTNQNSLIARLQRTPTKRPHQNRHRSKHLVQPNFDVPKWIPKQMGALNDLLDPSGKIGVLQDRYQATDALFQALHPNLNYVVSQDAAGNQVAPYIDWATVNMSLAELEQLQGWEGQIIAHYTQAKQTIDSLLRGIQKEADKRRAQVKFWSAQIRFNLQAVNGIQNAMKEAGKAATPAAKFGRLMQLLAAEEGKLPKNEQAAMPAREKIRSLIDKLDSYGKAHGASAALGQGMPAAAVKDLQTINKVVGGEAGKVGSKGWIGQAHKELGKLSTDWGDVLSNKATVMGVSGVGGALNDANIVQIGLAQQIAALSNTSLASALKQAQGASGGTQDDGLLAQMNLQLEQALGVSQAQYQVLSSIPFAGSFGGGGIVPGPVGAPAVAVVHGGEAIGMPGETNVNIHFANGMDWLRQFVTVEVSKQGRGTGRLVGRGLPGAGGGI